MSEEIKMTALAIVFATILGPILAVWASVIRRQRPQFRDRSNEIVKRPEVNYAS